MCAARPARSRRATSSCLFGGEETLLDPLRLDSLGFAYGLVTRALGFRMLRHEGKVTGLAAYGETDIVRADG